VFFKGEFSMKTLLHHLKGTTLKTWQGIVIVSGCMGLMTHAQSAPLAGSTIGNQAAASYTDTSGVTRSSTSNTVQTIVQAVGSYDLTASQTKFGAPGTTAYFPHTLTNLGNTADTFTLVAPANYAANDPTNNTSGAIRVYNANSGVNPATFDVGALAIYPDANGDGSPDSLTPITTTGTIPAGGEFKFVLAAQVPSNATNGQIDRFGVIASPVTTSIYSGAGSTSTTNVNQLTITNNAVLSVTKSVSLTTGPAGQILTYTLTYSNVGNAPALNVNLADRVGTGIGSKLIYVAGSGRWSGSGVTAMTDASGGDPAGINYFASTTSGVTEILAVIGSVPAATTASVTFQVTVANDAPVGNSTTQNVAKSCYNDGTANQPSTCTPAAVGGALTTTNSSGVLTNGVSTNTASYSVQQVATVVVTDSTIYPSTPTSTLSGDSDAIINDIYTVANASQGGSAVFTNAIFNTGNGTDSFNVVVSNTNFPAGTVFQIFQADGVTPLLDTNGDGIPDTGPLATGASKNIVVKAILPSTVTGAGPFNATTVVTSIFDNTKTDNMTNRLTAITSSVVDLRNANPNASAPDTCTSGALASIPTYTLSGIVGNNCATGTTGAAQTAVTTSYLANPGTNQPFRLWVYNQSTTTDVFLLEYGGTTTVPSGVTAGTPMGATGNGTVPSGWTVKFYADNSGAAADCSTLGTAITDTGYVAPNDKKLVCAVVAVPNAVSAIAGNYNFQFRVRSTGTGAMDYKTDNVQVNQYRNLSFVSDNVGQVYPGGTRVYSHLLTNNGNVVEGAGATNSSIAIEFPNPASLGWGQTLWLDTNNNGVLDANDVQVTPTNFPTITTGTTGYADSTAGLLPGETLRFFVKIQSPAAATPGTTESTVIRLTTTNTAYVSTAPAIINLTDVTTVISGQLELIKTQAKDIACDGTADIAFTQSNLQAKPGECIIYRIQATNNAPGTAQCVIITDATPANTTRATSTPTWTWINGGTGVTVTVGGPTASASGFITTQSTQTGAPCATNGFNMGGNESGTLEFGIRINP
jgi:uncharacterized repeat protein (TIGR01451 family)